MILTNSSRNSLVNPIHPMSTDTRYGSPIQSATPTQRPLGAPASIGIRPPSYEDYISRMFGRIALPSAQQLGSLALRTFPEVRRFIPTAVKALLTQPSGRLGMAGDPFSAGLASAENAIGRGLSRIAPALSLLPQVGSGSDPIRIQQASEATFRRGFDPNSDAGRAYRATILRGEITGREDVRGGRRPKPINMEPVRSIAQKAIQSQLRRTRTPTAGGGGRAY